jgi:hypothetical protein
MGVQVQQPGARESGKLDIGFEPMEVCLIALVIRIWHVWKRRGGWRERSADATRGKSSSER